MRLDDVAGLRSAEGWTRLVKLTSLGVGCLILAVAVGRVGRGLMAVAEPGEVAFGEAILYDHAARILRGEPLYQPVGLPPYTIAAYTPVYYAAAAVLQAIAGPGFAPGRLLSIVAAVVAVGLVGRFTADVTESPRAGLLASVVFLALGFPGRYPWWSLFKEDILGVALTLGAVVLLYRTKQPGSRALAGLVAGLAILTKQTFVAAAAAGVVWLWWTDRRGVAAFALSVAATVVAVAAFLELTTGAFLANTVLANAVPFTWDVFALNASTMLRYQWGPLLLAAIAVGSLLRQRRPAGKLAALYWLASFVPLVGLARAGSNHNYWIELAGASAVLAAAILWGVLRGGATHRAEAGALVAWLALGGTVLGVLPLYRSSAVPILSVARSIPNPAQSAALEAVVARVRRDPGETLADPLDVVALAGRTVQFEPYFFSILYSEGQWSPDPLIREICSGSIDLLVLDSPLESSGRGTYHGYAYWPAPVLETLRERMVLEAQAGGRYVYVRSGRSDSPSCGPGSA